MEDKNCIHTMHLLLCPLNISDLETAYCYSSDAELTRYMVFYPHHTKKETEEFLKNVTADWQREKPEGYEFAAMLGE